MYATWADGIFLCQMKRQEISNEVKKDWGKSIPHTNLTFLRSQVSVLLSGRPNTIDGLLKKNRKSHCYNGILAA